MSLAIARHRPQQVPATPQAEPRRPTGRRWRLLLVAIAALIIYDGQKRAPTGPAYGSALVGTPTIAVDDDRPLRIGTYNIHHGKGDDRVRDLQRTAACLEGLHFVGLNEVRGPIWPGEVNQAETLGRTLGLAWLFAPTERRWWYQDFGNGVLTGLQVDHWQRIPLVMEHGKSYRNAVLLRARWRERTVQIVVTHLDRRSDEDRAAQLRAVSELFLALAEPAIMMGDLNSGPDDPGIVRLRNTPGVADPVAIAMGDEAPPRIDWIFTRGFEVRDAGIVKTIASDHPYVWAELDLPREQE